MKLLPALAFLLLAPQDHRRIIDVKLTGMTSQGCYVAVEKALLKVKGVERVVYWCVKETYRTHVVVKDATVTLAGLEAALAAAEKDMKDRQSMTVDYGVDEAGTAIPAGTGYVADGKDLKTEKDMTLEELRKATSFTALTLPQKPHPVCAFVCPNTCSASDKDAICPKCGSGLVPVQAKKPDG